MEGSIETLRSVIHERSINRSSRCDCRRSNLVYVSACIHTHIHTCVVLAPNARASSPMSRHDDGLATTTAALLPDTVLLAIVSNAGRGACALCVWWVVVDYFAWHWIRDTRRFPPPRRVCDVTSQAESQPDDAAAHSTLLLD